MAKLRGSRFVREEILTEGLTKAKDYIREGEDELAIATIDVMINLYGKKLNEHHEESRSVSKNEQKKEDFYCNHGLRYKSTDGNYYCRLCGAKT